MIAKPSGWYTHVFLEKEAGSDECSPNADYKRQ